MIIAFAGQKGGSGKSTTAIAVAAEWHARGKRVLLVDADPQGSSRTWGETASQAGRETPTVVSMGPGLHRPDQLPQLSANFEATVLDCPPRHGEVQRAALMIADVVILPCGPSALDAWALLESVELVVKAKEVRPNLRAYILITKKVPRTALGSKAREVLQGAGLPVLNTELVHRIAYQQAPAAGMGVSRYAPGSQAAVEIRALVDELDLVTVRELQVAAAE